MLDQRADPGGVLTAATRSLRLGHDLADEQARVCVGALLDERANVVDTANWLAAMAAKGPSDVEISATVRVLRSVARPLAWSGRAVDIVGTGGDGSNSVNVSTIAGLIAAAAGATVAKVGNRAATGRCGSADVLERLGVSIDEADLVPQRLDRHRFAFLYSPAFHPALARLAAVRRRLGVRTVLNLAGPLSNPLALAGRVVGAASPRDQQALAGAAVRLGLARTWIVHGHGGLDELTTTGPNRILQVDNGQVRVAVLDPAELDLCPADAQALRGGDAEQNAEAVRRVLAGRATPAVADTCLLNAAAAVHQYDPDTDLPTALEQVRAAVHDGRARALLAALAADVGRTVIHPTPSPSGETLCTSTT